MTTTGFAPARGLAALAILGVFGTIAGLWLGDLRAAAISAVYALLCLYAAHVEADRVRANRRRTRTIRNLEVKP